MCKPTLNSLFIIGLLATAVPTPASAALYCKANCPNGSCWCLGCSCSCNGGNPNCGNPTALVAHTPSNTVAFIQPFAGDLEAEKDLDLSNLQIVREASQGIVTAGADGVLFYTPNRDFTGLDSFAFTACNLSGECDTATVLVDVVPGE